MIIRANINNEPCNAILDSGAGVSIIDAETLDRLNVGKKTVEASRKSLYDASGAKMNISGTITLKVFLPTINKSTEQIFFVLNESANNKILLGTDFMRKFGSVTFDFSKNKVQLGNKWILGKSFSDKKDVRLSSELLVPARSEKIFEIKTDEKFAFLPMEFEPRKIPGASGLYMSRARVNPNTLGYINVSILNVSEKDITIARRTRVGKIIKPNEIIGTVNEVKNDIVKEVNMGADLTNDQKESLENLIKKYEDVFAVDPKRPNRVKVTHRIITNNEPPVYNKAQTNTIRMARRS